MIIRIVLSMVVIPLLMVMTSETPKSGFQGSKHDFRKAEWAKADPCAVCHTPVNEKPPAMPPLWDPKADLNRTFGTPLARSARAGSGTAVCIRCHDGTVARNMIGRKDPFISLEHPGRFEAGHGRKDHPVGVDYPTVDRRYRPANAVTASGAVTLPGDKVECMSCHDPHDFSGEKHMLVMSNARSALCLTCHKK